MDSLSGLSTMQQVGIGLSAIAGILITGKIIGKVMKPSVQQRFQNKRVLITGASSGIGKALALRLAKYNAELCLVARREDKLIELKNEILAQYSNVKVHVITGDVSEESECKRIISKSVEEMNGLDVLILNAGIGCLVRLDEVPESDLSQCQRIMNVNYFANVHLSYYALNHLKASKGMIIVNSSLAGIGWSPGRCFYSASKHALRGFFNSLRTEVGDDIQITMTYPGFVLTEIHDVAYHAEGKALKRGKGFMTADKCAEIMLTGAANGERDHCMTWLGSFALKFTPFMGPLSDKIAIRKAKAGISQ